jgi:hypothetical protein
MGNIPQHSLLTRRSSKIIPTIGQIVLFSRNYSEMVYLFFVLLTGASQRSSIRILSPRGVDNTPHSTSLFFNDLCHCIHWHLHKSACAVLSCSFVLPRHNLRVYILGLHLPTEQTRQHSQHRQIRRLNILYPSRPKPCSQKLDEKHDQR